MYEDRSPWGDGFVGAAGADAVIRAFNPGWKNPHLYEDQMAGDRS
jgi:hypothetical protein